MGAYDKLLSDAKVMLTEINLHAANAADFSSKLKLRAERDTLQELIPCFEERKQDGLFSKFKNAMFETEETAELEKKAENLLNSVAQLEYCKRCRCADCPLMDGDCRCSGCVLGAYVYDCNGIGVEHRKIADPIVTINGMDVTKLDFDRATKETTAAVKNDNGIEERYRLDLSSGDARRV